MKYVVLLVLHFLTLHNFAQRAIGQWTSHIPNMNGLAVAEADERIYCVTSTGVFYYNTGDNSIQKVSKIDGLSGIDTRSIYYHKETKTVFLGYEDGTIDLIIDGNRIVTLDDVKRKSYVSKSIYKIQEFDQKIYFDTDFGIVVFDPFRKEFTETYLIGQNGYELAVYDLTADQTYFYAATEKGIKRAERYSTQLANYAQWESINYIPNASSKFNSVAVFNGKLVATFQSWAYNHKTYVVDLDLHTYQTLNPDTEFYGQSLQVIDNRLMVVDKNHISFYSDLSKSPVEFYGTVPFSWGNMSIEAKMAIITSKGEMWMPHSYYGLVRSQYNSKIPLNISPNGPKNNDAYYLDSKNNLTLVAAGAISLPSSNSYSPAAFFMLKDGRWSSIDRSILDTLSSMYDIVSVESNPFNSEQVYCCAWNAGVIEINFNQNNISSFKVYNHTNSTLKPFVSTTNWVRVLDSKVDEFNNLWVINPGTNTPINVKSSSGEWYAYATPSYTGYNWNNFIISSDGSKWFLLPNAQGLYVFNEFGVLDNTSSHFHKKLSVNDENGNVITNDVYAIAQDKNDYIWVGTNDGLVVFYSPYNVYDAQKSAYASKIIVESNGKNEYLMAGKKVSAIAVDGANRKWVGTSQSGLYLLSEDAETQLAHFNTDNSPLPSNQIKSISIDNTTGEVFIATGTGLMSYRSDAIEGLESYQDVYAYPNPVRPEYNGPIAIKGLVDQSIVKITDITGNLVSEIKSLGGQAIWDGKNAKGHRVATGVYLVLISNEKNEETTMTKILFIN